MSSDVVLTSALRNNLLSLQNTQSLIDKTQIRLATGLKVNSALDNPQSFFAAQSLNNRAGDLNRLLDGIGQSIRTIQEADNGVTALTSLVEQAQSIVSSARDELAASEGVARVVGTVDLSDVVDITAATFAGGAISAADVIRITTTDDAGLQIIEDIAIAAGDTGYTLAAKITDQFADNRDGEVTAAITDEGFLSIQSGDGRSFKLSSSTVATDILQAGWTGLGFLAGFSSETRTGAAQTPLTSSTVVAGNTISTISLYESAGDLAEANDLVTGTYLDADGNTVLSNATSFQLIVDDNGTTRTVTASTTSFQELVDSINQTNTVTPANDVSDLIHAEFDDTTGQLRFTSLSDNVRDITIRAVTGANGVVDIGFGDSSGELDEITAGGAGNQDFAFRFNNSTQELDQLANDYNTLRSQIDDIVKDAQYRGVNLLNGDDLTTFFNEDNTSQLITEGANFTANGLGLNAAAFRSIESIDATGAEASNALKGIRSFGSTLANNLSIIQTRQEFTKATINTLESGADDLTVADGNEEGANLLALQTRQTLGVTSLSLASQSAQSVLRLF
jgi:flagellin